MINEGDQVKLLEDNPQLGLSAGAVGVVWARYNVEPPAYDVTFRGLDGKEFDFLVYDEEIEWLQPEAPIADSNGKR